MVFPQQKKQQHGPVDPATWLKKSTDILFKSFILIPPPQNLQQQKDK